jgi:hypothetical protein
MNEEASELQAQPPGQEPRFRIDRTIWCFIIFALIGVGIFLAKEYDAFPEASIDLKLSKNEVASITRDWAYKLGFRKDHLIQSTTFLWDDNAKTYLEMEMGGKRANELMQKEIPIWYWRTRLVKEFDQEQFQGYISPLGELICCQFAIENDKALPSISQDDAREMATNFVEHEAKMPLTDYTPVQSSTDKLPHRTDHSFIWEDRKHPYKDAYMRIYVGVSGNTITDYYRYLYVPEAWQRKFNTIRSYNSLLAQIAFVFNSFLYLAAAFIVIWGVNAKMIRWRMGSLIALAVTVGVALLAWNNLPSIIDHYPPKTAFKAYLINYVVTTLGSCIAAGIVSSLLVMAGEAMYRITYPKKIAFENYFKLRCLSTVQVSIGLLIGLCMFAIACGWVVTYYLLGSKLGFWCPLDVGSYQVLSTYSPAYGALCLGVEAAFNEEILYRVIGLGLAKKLVRGRFWLANLMQAAAWGFAHSTYPQQPAYARGVELTLSGLLFGYICNRFGLLPCLVAHYLLDSFLTAQPLLVSGKPGLIASGLLPLAPFPLLAILAIARTRKQPLAETSLINEAIVRPKDALFREHEAEARKPFDYQPLSNRARSIVLSVMIVCTIIGATFGHVPVIGSNFHVYINRDQAIREAWEIMSEHHIPIKPLPHNNGWQVTAWLSAAVSGEEMQYLDENLKLPGTIPLADQTQWGYFWQVRFFKPLEAEEYEVDLNGRGKEIDFDTKLLDDAEGAKLSEADARAIAEQYLRKTHPEFWPFTFDSTTRNDKKNRADYTFTFTVPKLKVADADFKLNEGVVGDKISRFTDGWELPDKWKWARAKRTTKDEVCANIRSGATLVLLLLVLWWLFGLLRVGYFPFRPALIFGAVMAILYIPDALNDLVTIFAGYDTTMPMANYLIAEGVSLIKTIMGRFGQYGLAMLLALPCARLLMPTTNPISILVATFRPGGEDRRTHRQIWLDAVLLAFTVVAVSWALDAISTHVQVMVSPAEQESGLGAVAALANTFIPSISIFVDALSRGIDFLIVVPILAGFYAKYLKQFWRYLLFAVVVNCIVTSGERYWQDYVIDNVLFAINSVLVWLFVVKLARRNLLAYVLAGMAASIAAKLPEILEHAVPLFSPEAVASCLLLLLPVIYVLYLFFWQKGD